MPNILYIDDKHRDILVLHAINQQDPALDDILRLNACIPATPTGKRNYVEGVYVLNFGFTTLGILSQCYHNRAVVPLICSLHFVASRAPISQSLLPLPGTLCKVTIYFVGELLKRPVDLIDPNSDLATLYSLDDSRFPLSNSEYSSTETLFLLRQLGMATDSISWEVSP